MASREGEVTTLIKATEHDRLDYLVIVGVADRHLDVDRGTRSKL